MLALPGLFDWFESTLEPCAVRVQYATNTGITGTRLITTYVLVALLYVLLHTQYAIAHVRVSTEYLGLNDRSQKQPYLQSCKDLVVGQHDCSVIVRSEMNNNIIVHFSLLLLKNRSSNSYCD